MIASGGTCGRFWRSLSLPRFWSDSWGTPVAFFAAVCAPCRVALDGALRKQLPGESMTGASLVLSHAAFPELLSQAARSAWRGGGAQPDYCSHFSSLHDVLPHSHRSPTMLRQFVPPIPPCRYGLFEIGSDIARSNEAASNLEALQPSESGPLTRGRGFRPALFALQWGWTTRHPMYSGAQ